MIKEYYKKILVCLYITPLLAACSFIQAVPTQPTIPSIVSITPSVTLNEDVRQSIQNFLNQEVEARQKNEHKSIQTLLDPTADSAWVEQQMQSNPNFISIQVERITLVGNYALAAVIVTESLADKTNSLLLDEIYTYRTLHNTTVGWKLTSPIPITWGKLQTINLTKLNLAYYTFDQPYIQAIANQIEPTYQQIMKDFGIADSAVKPFTLHIVPLGIPSHTLSFWQQTDGIKLPSPLTPGFSLNLAESPEQFLLGSIVDLLGHRLLDEAFTQPITPESRLALAHMVIQWEVEEATGRSFQDKLRTLVAQAEAITPLRELLDPNLALTTENKPLQRQLFVYFMIETFGRERIAPFLQAVVRAQDAEEITQMAFDQNLAEVERSWQEWLGAE